jgi:hypothetical protein
MNRVLVRSFGINSHRGTGAEVPQPEVSEATIRGGFVVLGFAIVCSIFTVVMLPRVMH